MTNQSSNRGPVRTRSTSRTTSLAGQATPQSSSQGDDQKSTRASTLTSQVQAALDQQVVKGAKMMSNVANSTRRAADELQTDAPLIALPNSKAPPFPP
jgi:hypothetical protein